MLLNKHSQFANKDMKNQFVEDFILSFDTVLPLHCDTVVLSVGMRIKSPYLQAPEENYVNPQSNMGTKQYILDLYGNKKAVLRKTESISTNYKWPTVINDDGRELAVPHGIPCIFSTVEDAFDEKTHFEIKLVHNHLTIKANDEIVIDVIDDVPYPGGYTAFTTFDYDITVDNVTFTKINEVIKIKSFVPTALFLRGNPPKRVGILTLNNECEDKRDCYISVDGNVQNIGCVPVGESEYEVEIPDVQETTDIELSIFKEGTKKAYDNITYNLEPARKRTLWMCTTAHEDLGYCGWLDKLKEEMALYLDMAQNLCDKDDRYRYMIEHIWWLFGYGEVRSDEKMQKLIDEYLNTGKIEPLFAHSGTHTYWNRFEQLIRSTQYSRIEAKEKYGLDIKAGVYADTTGVSWQVAQAFSKAGCKYLLNARGPWRYPRKIGGEEGFFTNPCNTFPYYEPDLSNPDGLSYWVGPNGKDKLLIYTTWSYGGDRMGTFAIYKGYYEYRKFIIDNLNFRKDYPFDDILDPNYTDHLMPNDANSDLLDRFSVKYEYPKIKMCTLTEYFEHMEKNYADKIPTIRGELGSTWGDYATIDPESFTKKIEVAQSIPVIEKLIIMAKSMGIDIEYPYEQIYDMLWRCMEFDEHCWATMLPPKPDNVFNNDIAKKGAVSYAHDMCMSLLCDIKKKISQKAARDNSIVVVNTLSIESEQNICIDAPNGNFELYCDEHNIEYSKVDDKIHFRLKMPPLSVKVVDIRESKKLPVSNKSENTQIDTQYYRLTIENKNIVSVFDKELNAELIDKNAPYGFNTLLYVYAENYVSPETEIYCAVIDKTDIVEYDTFYQIKQYGKEPESNTKLENTITVFKNTKRIDIKNRIYDVSKLLYEGCMGKFYGDIGNRYMDNFFYAFPFNVPGFEFKIELPGCEADYQYDYVRYGVKDYVMHQNYIKAQGDDYTVTLFNKNAPCSHLGEIRYNRFEMDNVPKNPHIYSYVASSRMSGLHTRSIEDCDLIFEYSLYSSKNSDNKDISWEYKEPFCVSYGSGEGVELLPLVLVDNPNVMLTALKFTERIGDGIVVRLLNTTALPQKTSVKLDFICDYEAYILSVSEEITGKADLENIEVCGYDYITLLIKSKTVPESPKNVRIEDVSDNTIKLSWDTDGECFVFRGTKQGFIPMQYNLVGEVNGNSFIDTGLNKDTQYYYRICAVDKFNSTAFADEISVKTTPNNIDCPAPLKEIRVSAIDMNNLSLTFKISPENDIKYYQILRGTDRENMQPIDIVEASTFYLQFYKDSNLEPDTVYYYMVLPIDSDGNKAQKSPIASKKTPASDWWIVRSYEDKFSKKG